MSKQTVALALVLVGVLMLTWAVWQMQGQLVSAHEALFDLQQIERARKAKKKIPEL